MRRVLQVGSDWPFIGHFAAQSEAVREGMSRYVVVVPPGATPRHTEHLPALLVLERTVAGLRRLRREMERSTGVLVHGMEPFVAAAVALTTGRQPVMWSGWGYDYYRDRGAERLSLYDPQTLAYVDAGRRPSLRSPRRMIKGPTERAVRLAAARRVDYFSAPVPQDLHVFRESFPTFRGDYLQVNYGTLEDQYATDPVPGPRRDILLGNSADPSNNHLDVIDLLARRGLDGARVVVPLTYGPRAYAEHVAAVGSRALGDDFVPVMQHLPLEEYNRLVSSCGVIVMAHRRQQALGNIITAITSGAHVHMSPQSAAFAFLTELGIDIRDWNALDLRPSTGSRERDTERLATMWGRERVLDRTAIALDTLAGGPG